MRIAGVDEVGRGPLAGPVVAAAVIMPDGYDFGEIRDSKKLSPEKRDALSEIIKRDAIAWCCIAVGPRRIENINIREATKFAMTKAVLAVNPDKALIDGNMRIPISCTQETIIKGDLISPLIGAASIIAKVWRDNIMEKLHHRFPQYGFASHVGYPTPAHLKALMEYGPCQIHRRTFAPVMAAKARKTFTIPHGARSDRRASSEEVSSAIRI